jgi:ATPase subunit of ABC transporter with duplicated ATPase domains
MIERLTATAPPEDPARTVFTFPEPEEMSPPIITMEGVAVGYGGRAVLRRLNQRIDQDDRIALLGRNGEGKSTLSKLLAGKLASMEGKMVVSSRLRVGYFAQHQVDELRIDETPLQHPAACARTRARARPAPGWRASACRRIRPIPRWRGCRAGRRRGCRCCWPPSTRRIC